MPAAVAQHATARAAPQRLHRLELEIARAEVVWPGPVLADAYASLRTWCVRTGHGLSQKEHEADRWIAAIFSNVKDLELLTVLGADQILRAIGGPSTPVCTGNHTRAALTTLEY